MSTFCFCKRTSVEFQNTTSSVLDSSSQGESLQRKADLANEAALYGKIAYSNFKSATVQCNGTSKPQENDGYACWKKNKGTFNEDPVLSSKVSKKDEYIRRKGGLDNKLFENQASARTAAMRCLGLAGNQNANVEVPFDACDDASKGIYEYFNIDEDPVKTVVCHNADPNCVLELHNKNGANFTSRASVVHYHAATTKKKGDGVRGSVDWINEQKKMGTPCEKIQKQVERAPGYDVVAEACEHYLVNPF